MNKGILVISQALGFKIRSGHHSLYKYTGSGAPASLRGQCLKDKKYTLILPNIILLIFSIFTLCSCSQKAQKQQASDHWQAIIDARGARPEIHDAYLQCYALHPKEKKECTRQLAGKYLPKEQQANSQYAKSYQYEAEKLGFMNFLHEKGLSCDHLVASPTFIDSVKSYLVICQNNNHYLVSFDYKTKLWNYYR